MPPQRVRIGASPVLAALLGLVHLGAAVAFWLAPAPLWLKAAVTAGILASLAYHLVRTALLRGADAIVELEIEEDGSVSACSRRGERLECELLPGTFVSPRLAILSLRSRGRRFARHVVLLPDNVGAEEFRRLRAWLRWAAPALASRRERDSRQ